MARKDSYNGMNWIRQEKRIAIYIRDGWKCAYCGRCLKDAAHRQRQIDHIFPVALGGDNSAVNLVTICDTCNLWKSDRTIEQLQLGEAETRRILEQAAQPLDIKRAKSLLLLKKIAKKAA